MSQYSEIQKQELVKQYKNGRSVSDICEQYGISNSTIYNWIHLYADVKVSSGEILSAKKLLLLKQKIDKLIKELEIWKKSKCTDDAPLSKKLNAIESLYKEYGVHACCRVL